MKKIGMYLMIFGIGIFVLPMFGFEWKFMILFKGHESLIGLGSAIVGCIMYFMSNE